MNKQARLLAAVPWLKSYNGKSVIKGYAKWFGVDKLCAIRELKILGVSISETLEKQVTESVKQLIAQRWKRKSSDYWDDYCVFECFRPPFPISWFYSGDY
jgi:hypothetical protein